MKIPMFKQDLCTFLQNKTNWTGMTMIGTGIYLIHIGDIKTGMESIFGGLGFIFIRDGIHGVQQ